MMDQITSLARDLRAVGRPARTLYRGAAFWLLSAAVHLLVLAGDGWAWSGAVSFRKPFVFSLSIGLLLGTSGWVLDRLPARRRLPSILAWTLLVSSTVEVGLITIQAWRGRASHFNTLEAGDAAVFAAMGAMVGIMSLCLVTLLVWSIVSRPADPLVAVAVIVGMALVTTGLGIGQWIIELGNDLVATRGSVPDTVINGTAGVPKFPHAVAFHGIQLFIVAALVLRRGAHAEPARRRILWLVVAGYTGALLFTSLQTMMGVAPLAPSVWTLGVALSASATATGLWLAAAGLSPSEVPSRTARPVA